LAKEKFFLERPVCQFNLNFAKIQIRESGENMISTSLAINIITALLAINVIWLIYILFRAIPKIWSALSSLSSCWE